MKLSSACTTNNDPKLAVKECHDQLMQANPGELTWLGLYYTAVYDSAVVLDNLVSRVGSVPIHGGTACMGVMAANGFHGKAGYGMGLLAISDPVGSYGVGAAHIGNNPGEAAARALELALEKARRAGEIPALVWMNAAPGCEEKLIRGIEDVIGSGVPIAGGSTADNTVSGNWRQIAGTQVFHNAVVISVFFPSVELSYAFHSGYDPGTRSGKVTKAKGRTLYEIDGRPAAEVYNQWTNGLIQNEKTMGGNVLAKTTLAPLGREVGRVGNVPYFKLSHPNQVMDKGALTLFADIEEGDEIVLMTGSSENLISRAGRVTRAAITAGNFGPESIQGAIVIYCAGCMLTIRNEMNAVVKQINSALKHAPFLGVFTFGEQGCFMGNENSHGNLMISVVVFSNTPAY